SAIIKLMANIAVTDVIIIWNLGFNKMLFYYIADMSIVSGGALIKTGK
ncbi:3155_t:CDS:2, partial [Funneliformis geosporum]